MPSINPSPSSPFPTVVLKFGSSVLRTPQHLPAVVQEIYRHVRQGRRVVAVVSAFAGETDRLLGVARDHDVEDPRLVAALLATGETAAAVHLGAALERGGIPPVVLDAARAGLRTTPGLDAEPLDLDVRAFDAPVTVLPGFVGIGPEGEPTLLGRGGSDLTALFVASRLGARCVLLKDVDGICDADPALVPDARPFSALSWDEASALGAAVVQPKSVRWAQGRRLPFQVAALGTRGGTRVGPGTRVATPSRAAPLRVALLGHGTVGAGVFAALRGHPDTFEVVRVAVRSPARHRLPPELMTTDAVAAARAPCDVVVSLLGGLEPARTAIVAALDAGRTVVTANKAVLARHGQALSRRGAVHASASVGGAVPVLEAVGRLRGRIARIEGVVNGTSNAVLCALERGSGLDAALHHARRAGFAEADPSADLEGWDAACKLAVLARAAWDRELVVDWIPRDVVGEGHVGCRQLARVDAAGRAAVTVEPVDPEGPWGRLRGADNAVRIVLDDGTEHWLRGRGAGRWPTTHAVMADLWDLARERRPGRPALREVS